jgi:outer membrane protein
MQPAARILKWAKWPLLLALLDDLTACRSLHNSAAVNPYQYAPPTSSEPWSPPGTPLPLGRGIVTNSPDALSISNLPPAVCVTNDNFPGALARTNDLADLIDLAERINPQTRAAWEQARAAAARLGLADSAYAPVLALLATGGYSHNSYPASGGTLIASGPDFNPGVSLEWTLLDFGRRRATFDSAAQQLLQADFQFNRVHQQLAYNVQRAFYAFDSSRAEQAAAEATLETAQNVEHVANVRLQNGLGTESDLLQAQQELARAQFDLQSARRNVSDAWASLTESIGISPTVTFAVVDLSTEPLPTNLDQSVEFALDRAARQRPDLAAQLAQVRAREADVRRAEAEFRPSIGLSGTAGGNMGNWHVTASGSPASSYDYADPEYGAFLTFSWNLFDGFAHRNELREAQARRDEAEARLTALELQTQREVWKAYADAKASFVQYDFARALLTASENDYDAALTSYRNGLGTVIELLTAERDLARARTTLVESRADVLSSSAALAFAVGDSISGPGKSAVSTTEGEK